MVDGAFNQKPILTRMVVAVAGLLALALIAGIVYLLTRPDEADPAEQAQQPDQPSGLQAAAVPGIVTLTWDRVAGVQAYELVMTAPVTDESEIASAPVADDDSKLESKIKVETEDTYCYQLIAVREGAADSAPSDEACVDTVLPPEATEGPTESPTIVPLPPEPTDGGATSGGASPSPAAGPLPFISVLEFYPVGASADPAAQAAADQAALADLGFPAKVLLSDDVTLTPPLAQPSYVLYVDGNTADEATAACSAIAAASPVSVPNGCLTPFAAAPK